MSNHVAFNYAQHVAGEIRRMLDRQKELDVASLEYRQLFENLELMVRGSDFYADLEKFFELADEGIVEIVVDLDGAAEQEGAEDEDESESGNDGGDDAAEPEKETGDPAQVSSDEGPAEPEPVKTYEMAEVRAALVAARRGGTNVTELLKEFGVDNFSAFPAGRYAELMKRLGVA